ncbi:MAG: hypothetical protein ABI347_12220 [Nitrososphaera sp.]
MPEEKQLEELASALEDLLYMGAIRVEGEKATLSPQFALVASNVLSSMKEGEKEEGAKSRDDVMKLMYYSLLIYMSEQLKIPKALTIALGNDMENNRQMESGTLVTTYVNVLSEIWSKGTK